MFERFRGCRRPSAPMAISLVALFFAVGGVGYAAATLPPNSVGTAQLKRGAVTNSRIHDNAITWNKVAPGTIGSVRINQALVQTRVIGTCSGTNGAIGRVLQSGRVICNPSASQEFGTTSASTPVTTMSTTVASRPLTAGTYLLLGEAYATATSGTTPTLTCTLAVPGGSSQTRSTTVPTGGQAALPVNLASAVAKGGATSTLSCSTSAGSTATVAGQINAIQTSGNS
jgi:hypothetical protein